MDDITILDAYRNPEDNYTLIDLEKGNIHQDKQGYSYDIYRQKHRPAVGGLIR